MSMRALLGGVADRLRTVLSFSAEHVGVQLDGQPPPFAGQWYIAVHPGTVMSQSRESLDERYGANVTLTMRAGEFPADRLASDLQLPTDGLYHKADAIRVAIHAQDAVLELAGGKVGQVTWTGGKAYSLPATVNGFVEALRFASMSPPEPKGPSWFWAEDQDDAVTGVAITLAFADARRVQTIESMT